ncbi:unnamed protein product, partial [Amoebophrya sp. A25]|eukprot:GSA25T00024075001.1
MDTTCNIMEVPRLSILRQAVIITTSMRSIARKRINSSNITILLIVVLIKINYSTTTTTW